MLRRVSAALVALGAAAPGCDIGRFEDGGGDAWRKAQAPLLKRLGGEVAGQWAGEIADVSFTLELVPRADASTGDYTLACVVPNCEGTLPGANTIITVFPHAGPYRLNSIDNAGQALVTLNPLDLELMESSDLATVGISATLTGFMLDSDRDTLEFTLSPTVFGPGPAPSWQALFVRL